MSETRWLVVKGKGGLGNRLLSLLTAMVYAQLSGRRLVVDWRDPVYSDDGSDAFQRLFDCETAASPDALPATDSVTPDVWRGRLDDSIAVLQRAIGLTGKELRLRSSIDVTRIDYGEEVAVMWAMSSKIDLMRRRFRGPFRELRPLSTKAILQRLLREELRLNARIGERVGRFRQDDVAGETVGVHARYGDRRVRLGAIVDHVDTLVARQPGLRIFLATDNIAVKEHFERRYAATVTTPHWYPRPGDSAHQNRDCPDRAENAVEALVDLYLLASCEWLVVDTTSSFSRIAEALSQAAAARIFDVRRLPRMREHVLQRLARPDLLRRLAPG